MSLTLSNIEDLIIISTSVNFSLSTGLCASKFFIFSSGFIYIFGLHLYLLSTWNLFLCLNSGKAIT